MRTNKYAAVVYARDEEFRNYFGHVQVRLSYQFNMKRFISCFVPPLYWFRFIDTVKSNEEKFIDC